MELKRRNVKNKVLQYLVTKASSKGKKQQSEKDVLKALRTIKRSKKNICLKIVPFLDKVLKNIEPQVVIISKKIGKNKYKIPIYASQRKELVLGISWLIHNSCGRNRGGRYDGLVQGLCDTWEGLGLSVQEKKKYHQLGLDNRAYIRYL